MGRAALKVVGAEAGHRELGGEGLDLVLEGDDVGVLVEGRDKVLERLAAAGLDGQRDLDGAVQEPGDGDKVGLLEAARRERRRADADTAGRDGADVAVDGVLVERDGRELAQLLQLAAGQVLPTRPRKVCP